MLWPTCQKFLPSFCLFSKNGFTFLQSPCVDCPIAPRIHLLHVYKLLLRSKALLHSNFIVWQGYFIGNDSFFHHEVHNTCCSALTLATIWSSMLSHSNRAYSCSDILNVCLYVVCLKHEISLPMFPLFGKLPFPLFHTGRPVHISVSELTDWWYFSRINKCQPWSFLSSCMFTFCSCFCLSFVDQWKLLIVTWAKKISVYSVYICATRATQLYVF